MADPVSDVQSSKTIELNHLSNQMQGQAQSQEDDSSERNGSQTKNYFIKKLRRCICSDRFDILLKVCLFISLPLSSFTNFVFSCLLHNAVSRTLQW